MAVTRIGPDRGSAPSGPLRTRHYTKTDGPTIVKESFVRGQHPRSVVDFFEDVKGPLPTYDSGPIRIVDNVSNAGTAILPGANTNTAIAYYVVPRDGVLIGAKLVSQDTVTANDTNYFTFALANTLLSGAGSTAMLAATDANTTKATGGSTLTAQIARSLTLNGTAANLRVNAGDVLLFTATATQSPTVSDSPTLHLQFATLPFTMSPLSVRTTTSSAPNLCTTNPNIAGGEMIATLSAASDAIATGFYWGDQVTIPATTNRQTIFQAWCKVGTVTTAQRMVIGLASAYNNTLDNIVTNAWFKCDTSLVLVLEADDGTTDTDDQACVPATTLTADTYYLFTIDFNATSGLVEYWVNDTHVGSISAPLLVAANVCQPLIAIQKDSGVGAISIYCDSLFARYDRS